MVKRPRWLVVPLVSRCILLKAAFTIGPFAAAAKVIPKRLSVCSSRVLAIILGHPSDGGMHLGAEFAKDIQYRDMCCDTVLASHASQFLATCSRSLTLPSCAAPLVQVFDLHCNPSGPDIFAISGQCFRC